MSKEYRGKVWLNFSKVLKLAIALWKFKNCFRHGLNVTFWSLGPTYYLALLKDFGDQNFWPELPNFLFSYPKKIGAVHRAILRGGDVSQLAATIDQRKTENGESCLILATKRQVIDNKKTNL